jgi:hypothetical protein
MNRLLIFLFGLAIFAQPKPAVTGDYSGVLGGALHLKLHIAADPSGALTGSLDSLDLGAMDIPCSDFHLD